MLCQWNYIVYNNPWGLTFSLSIILWRRCIQSIWILDSFILLCSSLWYEYNTVYSPIERLLGHFQCLVITNKTAVNIMYKFMYEYTFPLFWGKMLTIEILELYGNCMFSLIKPAKPFYKVVVTFYISIILVIQFLSIRANIWYCHYFLFYTF